MGLFKHKHTYHPQNHLEPHQFNNGVVEEAVILVCDCTKCEKKGTKIAYRISELQGAFTEGRDSIIRYLDNYNSSNAYTKAKLYNDLAFWEHLANVGVNNQRGGKGSKIKI